MQPVFVCGIRRSVPLAGQIWLTGQLSNSVLESKCLLLAFKCQLESSTRQNERGTYVHSSTESHLNPCKHTHTHSVQELKRVWMQWLLHPNTHSTDRKSERQSWLVVDLGKKSQCVLFFQYFLSILCFRLHVSEVSRGRSHMCCWLQRWMLAAGACLQSLFVSLYLLDFFWCVTSAYKTIKNMDKFATKHFHTELSIWVFTFTESRCDAATLKAYSHQRR